LTKDTEADGRWQRERVRVRNETAARGDAFVSSVHLCVLDSEA
jgi:hypothetical protein